MASHRPHTRSMRPPAAPGPNDHDDNVIRQAEAILRSVDNLVSSTSSSVVSEVSNSQNVDRTPIDPVSVHFQQLAGTLASAGLLPSSNMAPAAVSAKFSLSPAVSPKLSTSPPTSLPFVEHVTSAVPLSFSDASASAVISPPGLCALATPVIPASSGPVHFSASEGVRQRQCLDVPVTVSSIGLTLEQIKAQESVKSIASSRVSVESFVQQSVKSFSGSQASVRSVTSSMFRRQGERIDQLADVLNEAVRTLKEISSRPTAVVSAQPAPVTVQTLPQLQKQAMHSYLYSTPLLQQTYTQTADTQTVPKSIPAPNVTQLASGPNINDMSGGPSSTVNTIDLQALADSLVRSGYLSSAPGSTSVPHNIVPSLASSNLPQSASNVLPPAANILMSNTLPQQISASSSPSLIPLPQLQIRVKPTEFPLFSGLATDATSAHEFLTTLTIEKNLKGYADRAFLDTFVVHFLRDQAALWYLANKPFATFSDFSVAFLKQFQPHSKNERLLLQAHNLSQASGETFAQFYTRCDMVFRQLNFSQLDVMARIGIVKRGMAPHLQPFVVAQSFDSLEALFNHTASMETYPFASPPVAAPVTSHFVSQEVVRHSSTATQPIFCPLHRSAAHSASDCSALKLLGTTLQSQAMSPIQLVRTLERGNVSSLGPGVASPIPMQSSTIVNTVPPVMPSTALVNNSKRRPLRTDLTCEHCSRVGHSAARCWALHPELRPASFTRPSVTNDSSLNPSAAPFQQQGNR